MAHNMYFLFWSVTWTIFTQKKKTYYHILSEAAHLITIYCLKHETHVMVIYLLLWTLCLVSLPKQAYDNLVHKPRLQFKKIEQSLLWTK